MKLLKFKVSIEMCGLIRIIRLLIFGVNVCVFSGTLCFNNYEFILIFFAISAVFIPLFNLNNIASYIFFRFGLLYIIFRLFIFWIFLSSLVMRDIFADYIYSRIKLIIFSDLKCIVSDFSGFQSFHSDTSWCSDGFSWTVQCIFSVMYM